MTQEPDPIAYTALRPGTPVRTADGQQFATVESVLAVEDVDVFDGIVVGTDAGTRFVDADQITRIFTDHVETNLSADAAAALPPPDQDAYYKVDPRDDRGNSIGDRFDRWFGHGKWKRER